MGNIGGLFLFSLLSFHSAFAGDDCASLLNKPLKLQQVTIQEQLNLVQTYESKAKKQDQQAITTDIAVLELILQVYKTITEETVQSTQKYSSVRTTKNEAIDRYLAHRYQTLSDREANTITKVLKSTSWNETKVLGRDHRNDMTAVYIPDKKRIHFEMPDHYKDTLIHWLSFFHEMEHAIQHARLLNDFDNHNHNVSGYAYNEIKYLAELGAMTAEWSFLQGVSKSEILKARKEIMAAKDIEPSYRALFLRILKNCSMPLDQYLASEHSAGRYSRQLMVIEEAP